jgi:hypothetical protein
MAAGRKPYRLSEICFRDSGEWQKIVGASVHDGKGRELGKVEDVYFDKYFRGKKAVVELEEGFSVVVSAWRLLWDGEKLILTGEEKWCPLSRDSCVGPGCAWWIEESGRCAVHLLPEEVDLFPAVR